MMRFLVHAKHPLATCGGARQGLPQLRKRARGPLVARGRRAADPMALQAESAAPAAARAAQNERALEGRCSSHLRKARCSWTMYATRAEHEKFVLRWGYLHQLPSPHRFCTTRIRPRSRTSTALPTNARSENAASLRRGPRAPAQKNKVDARSLPRRLLRLHPRHDAVELLRSCQFLGVAPPGAVQDPREHL